MQVPAPRRGRRPGQTPDLPAPEGHLFNAETRIAWLLRSWRLTRLPDSSARPFARMLTNRHISADASRVSRWETGQIAAPIEVLAGYEDILSLPPGELPALATHLRRLASGSPLPRVGYAPDRFDPETTESLLDLVVDGEPTGRDWFEFGMCVSALGDRLTLPRSVWRSTTRRLVTELGVSVGNAYLTRAEASILLANHRSGQRALVSSVGEVVTEPDSMLVIDAMSLTQEMRGQPANMLVLRLVDHPNRSMRNAAQWAATMKLERGHFGRHELALLEGAVARLVAEEDGGGVGAGRLSDLVSALPEDARARIRPVVGHAHGERGRPDPSAAARRAAVNLAQETASVTEDSMFERLVVTALSDPTADQRFAAAFVLRSSPWSEELARVCVARVVEQLSSRSGTDRDVLQRTMVLMSIIGREAEREPLARMVENGPANLRPLALFSLGHLPPPASGVEPPRLPLRPLLLGDDERVARAALYCAGMTADPALGEIDDDEALADWLRRGARWWRRNGPAIHEPAPSWTQPP